MTLEERIARFNTVAVDKKFKRDYSIEEDERISEEPAYIEEDERFLSFYVAGTLSPEQRQELNEALAERYGDGMYNEIGSKARADSKGGPGRCEFISVDNGKKLIKISNNAEEGLEIIRENVGYYEEINAAKKLGKTPAIDWTSQKVKIYDAKTKTPTDEHKPFYVVMHRAEGSHVFSDLKDPTIEEQTFDKLINYLETEFWNGDNLSTIENQARNSISQLMHLFKERYINNFKGLVDEEKTERKEKLDKAKDKLLGILSEYAKVAYGIQDPADNFMYLDTDKEHIVILDQGLKKEAREFAAENNIKHPYHELPILSLGRLCEYIETEHNISDSVKNKFKQYTNDVIYREHWGERNEKVALLGFNLGRYHMSLVREFHNPTPANKERSEYLLDVILNE